GLLLHAGRSAGEQRPHLRRQRLRQADLLRGLNMAPARVRLLGAAALLLFLAAPAMGAVNSARYRFQGNTWLTLDLAVGDVRTDVIRFDWPSTVLGIKTGYKATVKVVNGSSRQVSVGLAVAIYDSENKLVGVGSTG